MARIYLEFMSLKLVKGSVPGLSKTGESGFASPARGSSCGGLKHWIRKAVGLTSVSNVQHNCAVPYES
jgi:hypothetical protein